MQHLYGTLSVSVYSRIFLLYLTVFAITLLDYVVTMKVFVHGVNKREADPH